MALKPDVLAALGRSFEERAGSKLYTALVHGRFEGEARAIESHLAPSGKRDGIEVMASVRSGGKRAVTHVRVLERGTRHTLVECSLETGRTHQIRVHLSEAGHPIVGDELYGAPEGEHRRHGRHLLHAHRLELPHPAREGATLLVESPLPASFRAPLDP